MEQANFARKDLYSLVQTEDIILKLRSTIDSQRGEIEDLERKLIRYRNFTKKLQCFLDSLLDSVSSRQNTRDQFILDDDVVVEKDIGKNIDSLRKFFQTREHSSGYISMLENIEKAIRHKDFRLDELDLELKEIQRDIRNQDQEARKKEIREISESSLQQDEDEYISKLKELNRENKYLKDIISKCSGHIQALNFN